MNTKTITNTNTYKDDLCPGLEWPRAAGSFLQSPNNQTTERTLPTFYISSLLSLSRRYHHHYRHSCRNHRCLHDHQNSTRIRKFLQNTNCPPWHDVNCDNHGQWSSWYAAVSIVMICYHIKARNEKRYMYKVLFAQWASRWLHLLSCWIFFSGKMCWKKCEWLISEQMRTSRIYTMIRPIDDYDQSNQWWRWWWW